VIAVVFQEMGGVMSEKAPVQIVNSLFWCHTTAFVLPYCAAVWMESIFVLLMQILELIFYMCFVFMQE
jgi:hypothetical protein